MSISKVTEKFKNADWKPSAFKFLSLPLIGILMFIQRFLAGGYRPVMDDWFLYGDLYSVSDRISKFAVENEKFAIRPFASIIDLFINAPLFEHLWIAELFATLALLFGIFFIIKALRRHNMSGIGILLCLICLLPLNLEATYWIAAATRISYSVFFIGAAVYSLDYYYKTKKMRGIIFYSVLGLISVGFYEPAIVIYFILSVFIVIDSRKTKSDLIPLLIMFLHIAAIGIYYLLNSGSGEIESRGGFVTDDIISHITFVWDKIRKIFITFNAALTKHGFNDGYSIVSGGHYILKLGAIIVCSSLLGIFSAMCLKKRRFSFKILSLGIALLLGGVILNFLLGSDRIPIRLVFFSFLGIGIIVDELFMLFPAAAGKILCGLSVTFLASVFTISGIGEVNEFITVSEYDVQITQQLIDLDGAERLTNPYKNTYLFGGQHGYTDIDCIHYVDHIRGASGTYADMTGCMRHLTGVVYTNSILPFTYSDINILKPYIDIEGLCHFYALEYDKTVIPVSIVPERDNYNIVRNDGSVFGVLEKVDDTRYQFFN